LRFYTYIFGFGNRSLIVDTHIGFALFWLRKSLKKVKIGLILFFLYTWRYNVQRSFEARDCFATIVALGALQDWASALFRHADENAFTLVGEVSPTGVLRV
jgi:hypothetical protein